MSVLSFTPHVHVRVNPILTPKPKPKPKLNKLRISSLQTFATPPPQPFFSDPFVLQLADSLPSSSQPLPLQKLRDFSSQTLLSTPWPSRDTQFPNLIFIDGFLKELVLNLSNLPDGVYLGSLLRASDRIMERVSKFIGDFKWGDLFWSINGMGAPDLGVIYVPAGCKVEIPIYLRYFSVEGGNEGSKKLPISNPRVFVLVEEGGEVGIVEEFVGKEGNACYWANPVLEVVIGGGGKVRHSYVQSQSLRAAHIKWTTVRQVNSCYCSWYCC
ncbi:hypothetical protein Patl1_03466 [Pistacia atlantica]|uniref:Uncharacterized protein n=1 Tax=Pistacia atlantica TaxID=434234 RepID=A0ACC1C7F1_9ROSI|nr:hypothetical protein Patl1_03466 [Pistacia atlantica]